MASLGEAVVEIGADTTKFRSQTEAGVNSALKSSTKSMQNLGRGISNVGRQATMSLTLPIVGAGIAALKLAGDFEQSMNVLQAATGLPSKSMAALEQQAKDLGASTVFSANDAAEAMLELGRSGFNAAQISAAVPEVMNLAATEGLELANAAGIVSSALSQFGLEAADSAQVVNALAGASNASRASVASLSESMKLVGSAASGIGLTVQETAGALAALADSGLEGSMAGTSLASVFNHLTPMTSKAAAAMKELGLDFTNAKGEFDSIDVIAEKLQTTFQGMDRESRKIALSKIFGNDASVLASVNALMKQGEEGLQKYTKAANDQSAASKLADARMKGLKGAIETMKGALETAALTFGQALSPVIEKVAGVITVLAEKFGSLDPKVQQIILVVAGLAAAIGPVLVVAGTLITSIGAIAGVLGAVGLPIIAVVAGIAALVAGIVIAYQKSEQFRQIVHQVLDGLMTFANFVKTTIVPIIVDMAKKVAANLQPIWKQFAETMKNDVFPAIQKIIAKFREWWPAIQKVITVVAKVIATWAKFYSAILGKVIPVIIKVVGWIIGKLVPVILRNIDVTIKVIAAIIKFGTALFNAGKKVVEFSVKIAEALGKAYKEFMAFPGKVKSALTGFIADMFGIGKDLVMGLINGIKAFAGSLVNAAKDVVKGAIDGARGLLGISSPSKVFHDIGTNVVLGFINGLNDNANKAAAATEKLMEAIVKAVKDGDIGKKAAAEMKKAVNEILKEAERAQNIMTRKLDFGSALSESLQGEFNLEELAASGNIEDITAGASGIAARIVAFTKKLGALAKAGIPAQLISEVSGLGSITGSAVADTLLNSSKKQRQELRNAFQALNQVAGAAGAVGGTAMFGTNADINADLHAMLQQIRNQTKRNDGKGGPKGPKAPRAGDQITINQNYYGPQTGRDRLREMEWTLRYATKARRGGDDT